MIEQSVVYFKKFNWWVQWTLQSRGGCGAKVWGGSQRRMFYFTVVASTFLGAYLETKVPYETVLKNYPIVHANYWRNWNYTFDVVTVGLNTFSIVIVKIPTLAELIFWEKWHSPYQIRASKERVTLGSKNAQVYTKYKQNTKHIKLNLTKLCVLW